jgi:sulfatase modifying factor 1
MKKKTIKKKPKENPLKVFKFIPIHLKAFKFIPIHPGKFTMGSQEDKVAQGSGEPQKEVEITKRFEMQDTQVTQLQYSSIMDTNPSTYEGLQKPVQNVSWNDVQDFIKKLNELDKDYTYRLPTEAEWEYCCRAGTTTPYSNTPLENYAHFNSNDGPINVQSKLPNPWGLYDMHGNVWEWCQDWYGA